MRLPRKRINALAQYLLALAGVVMAYSCYLRYAVPVIEGPPNVVRRKSLTPMAELPPVEEDKSYLQPLLPQDSWEFGECKTLLVESGTILFQEIEQLPNGTMQITPFTLISNFRPAPTSAFSRTPKLEPKTPMVLRCLDGANLAFDKPMKNLLAGGGKVESAHLVGDVDIYRPPIRADRSDELHLLTSNVQIDKQRIRTIDDVTFSFGRSRGRGRNLIIDLAHDADQLNTPDFSSIAGVDRLELAFLDRLRIEPPSQETAPNRFALAAQRSSSDRSKLFSGNRSPLEIRCAGAFIFDFKNRVATFTEDVVARQDDAFQDRIECERLVLTFEEAVASSIPPSSTLANEQTKVSTSPTPDGDELRLKHFLAIGTPAQVTSTSRAAMVSGERLSYDLTNNRIEADCAQNSARSVTLVSDEYQMRTKRLSYVVPADGSLGPVECDGPGQLLHAGKDNKEFFATWNSSLKVAIDPAVKAGRIITLDGDTEVRFDKTTRVSAEQIQVRLWQVAQQAAKQRVPASDSQRPHVKWEYLPNDVVATGNVRVTSPKFSGNAKRMTATWPAPETTVGHYGSPFRVKHRQGFRGPQDRQDGLQVAEGTTSGGSISGVFGGAPNQTLPANLINSQFHEVAASQVQPLRGAAGAGGGVGSGVRPVGFLEPTGFQAPAVANAQTPAADEPLLFQGDSVDIRLLGQGDNLRLRDLAIDGNVNVVAASKGRQGDSTKQLPSKLSITGARLRLVPQFRPGQSALMELDSPEQQYRALVSGVDGQPAKLVAEEFKLEGAEIDLDQIANKIWVDGAGRMLFTPTTDPADNVDFVVRRPGQPDLVAVSESLDASWKGGMIFDGAKIYFEHDVLLNAVQLSAERELSKLKSYSEGLSIELTRPVNFENLSRGESVGEVSIREVVIVDEVGPDKRVFKIAALDNKLKRPVVVERQAFDRQQNLVEQQKFVTPHATIDAESGLVKAKGPGTLATHQLQKSKADGSPLSRLVGPTAGSANATAANQKGSGIMFVQVNFDGELSVNEARREMLVEGRTRTIYVPVKNWQQAFDPDRVQQSAPGSLYLTCERLQLAQWRSQGSAEPTSEVIATGNAHIFSEQYNATADRVSYSEATDVLIIEGTPRTDARISGPSISDLSAKKIKYRISDQRLDTEGISNLSGRSN